MECCVCMERGVACVLVPCGHCLCCDEACPSSRMSECPTCAAAIQGRSKLFGVCRFEDFVGLNASVCRALAGLESFTEHCEQEQIATQTAGLSIGVDAGLAQPSPSQD
jgi:hypothetical protein